MKRKIISSLALALVIALSIAPVASASDMSTQASEYLSRYVAYIYPEGSGDLSIWFEVQGTGTMDEIGALSIRLQERSNSKSAWTTIKTYSYTDYPNMLAYNDNLYVSSVDYSGKEGCYYRADVTIWAGKNGNGDSRSYITDVVTA